MGQKTKASKKPLADAPPEADSSDDDSATTGEEEEDVEHEVEEETSDDEEEETIPVTPPPPPPSSAKKTSSSATTVKRPAPELENDNDDSSTDDETPMVPRSRPVSKPNTDSKSRSKPTVSALPAEKRPSETDVKGTSSKRPRKEKEKEKQKSVSGSISTSVSGSGSGVQEEGKKLFQRVFSEDDEIEILKGMIEYRSKRGADPMFDVDDFYAFVRKSLHVDVNKVQIVDKVRRLKKKFFNAKKKKLSNPHEIQAFELSKKIWESTTNNVSNNEVEEEKFGNGGVEVSNHDNNVDSLAKQNPISTPTPKARVLKSKSAVSEEVKKSSAKDEEVGGKVVEGGEEGGFELGEEVAWDKLRKKGLRLMGAGARAEIEEMWGKVAMKQAEAKMLRSEVEQEEIRRIMEALRTGKD